MNFLIFPTQTSNFQRIHPKIRRLSPFAALLDGSEAVIVQGLMDRELDGKSYKYVGVSGTDNSELFKLEFQNRNWSENQFDNYIIYQVANSAILREFLAHSLIF